jgi:hypothetical protein
LPTRPQSASTTITLTPFTVTPTYTNLFAGFSQQFTSNVPASWIIQQGTGTISPDGLYTSSINQSSNQYVWIQATAQADPNAIVYVYLNVLADNLQISPSTSTLLSGQTLQFSGCGPTGSNSWSCPANFNWSISPAGAGSISSSGIYSAPAYIATEQTVTVTGTDPVTPGLSITATVTLLPPTLTVNPAAFTIYGDQSEQFFATMTNTTNSAVNWSISPSGVGSLSSTGIYTAPLGIPAQQMVTITATSQAFPELTASATVTLAPQCPSSADGYVRSIVIDHNRGPLIPIKRNFPFLFSATDPGFMSVANGGHVTSAAGDDIYFSSDPGGAIRLDYELEQYNPATGQILTWVRVPNLSHSTDTVIYMFYGNPSITAPQQNPGGVWDTNFQSVYHLDNLTSGMAIDSTGNGNTVPASGLSPVAGDFDTAASFDGATSNIVLPSPDFASYPTNGPVCHHICRFVRRLVQDLGPGCPPWPGWRKCLARWVRRRVDPCALCG